MATIAETACVGSGAWVDGSARVYGWARVDGSALVYGSARVYGWAWVGGSALVYGSARVYGWAWVVGSARVYGWAWVDGSARVYGSAMVYGSARVGGSARVYGSAMVYGSARVGGSAMVGGDGIIERRSDLLVVQGLGDSGSLTIHRTRSAPWHRVNAGCWAGTLDEMEANLGDPEAHWPDASDEDRARFVAEYGAVLPLLRARAAMWTEGRDDG